jgi:membrane fusion protein
MKNLCARATFQSGAGVYLFQDEISNYIARKSHTLPLHTLRTGPHTCQGKKQVNHKDQSTSFFRPEVTASNHQLGLGAIRISQPISSWFATTISLIVVVAFIAYIMLGSVTRKDKVSGITVPEGGNTGVFASSSGTVMKFLVAEGEHVKAGQALFEISTERQNGSGAISVLVARQLANRKASIEVERQLRLVVAEEKRDAAQKKLSNLESEINQIQQEIGLAERRSDLAQISLSKYQTLLVNGYISGFKLQEKEGELIDADARLSTLKRAKLQTQQNILEAISEQKSIIRTTAVEQAQLKGNLASLEQEITENSARKENYIIASKDGIVATIMCQHGQVVNTGQTLAMLTPSTAEQSRLEVHLYLPSRTVGFIKLGQTVLIRYHAFPYEKFGLHKGTVTDISKNPFAATELPTSLAGTILSNALRNTAGFNGGEGLYRIKVRLHQQGVLAYGKMQGLKPAMTLEADIIQERRRIWEWIAEPILAAAQRQPLQ